MTGGERKKYGVAGSVLVHCMLLFLLAASGIFAGLGSQAGVTEITFFGGGGGGGGSGGTQAGSAAVMPTAPQPEDGAITGVKRQGAPQQRTEQRAAAQTTRQAAGQQNTAGANGSAQGTGSGGGKGTGHGTGTGSGIGPGSGSGSGGGHGSGHGTGTGAGIGDGITANPAVAPKILHSVSPVYPETQRLTGVTGTVRLRLLIGTDGSVESVVLVNSSGSRPLDNAAVNACRRWRFAAARNEAGQRVRCYWEIPIRFDLNH